MTRNYSRLVSRRSFLGGGIAAIGATAAVAIPLGVQGHFYPGTTVSALDLGGKSQADGEQMLRAHFAAFEQSAVTFTHDDRTWIATLAELGFSIDYDATLRLAFQHGRDDGILGRYATWLRAGDDRESFGVAFTHDDATLDAYLTRLAADVAVPAKNATLTQNGTNLDITADVDGSVLDLAGVRSEVVASVQSTTVGTIPLSMLPVTAEITEAKLAAVRDDAATLLDGPVTIVSGDASWSIEAETLATALVIPDDVAAKPSLDPDKLVDAVTDIANSLYVDPVNAIVGWDNGPYAIQRGKYGQMVDAEALAKAVVSAAGDESRTATVPLTDVLPDIRSDNLETLGLKELMASGDSSFTGSSDARSTNVQVAAQHISATLIPPGSQFSFNQSLGPISVDNGYVEGKIIQGQWYASDLGGGVCQVSTTVYRAALKAGIQFDEWHPHSFRVSFYELDGWPPGIDAAIYQPNAPDEWELDLKFTNPTDGWMLLQMVEDSEKVTAQLFGQSLGYEVELSDPTVSDPIPPGDPIERKTTDLPVGTKQEAQVAAPGYDVVLVRTLKQGGEVVDQETFESNYQAQPEVIEVGVASDDADTTADADGSGN